MRKLLTTLSLTLFLFTVLSFTYMASAIAAEQVGGIFGVDILEGAGKVDFAPAEGFTGGDRIQVNTLSKNGIVVQMLVGLINFLVKTAMTISTLFIVYGGFQYVSGSLLGTADGKKTITYAIIGLIVSLLAFGITSAVSDFFAS